MRRTGSETATAILVLACYLGPVLGGGPPDEVPLARYLGTCDASAAVEIGPGRLLVASDEDNRLRLYEARGGPPVATSRDLSLLFRAEGRKKGGHREVDLEGACRLGKQVVWIGSHGRSAKGKRREGRHRLVALRISVGDDEALEIERVGAPYTRLMLDLADQDGLAWLRERAPAAEVEGLAASPDGRLLIGFRQPLDSRGRALVIELANPSEVFTGEAAKFGSPVLLDLAGRGIRSLEYVGETGSYYLVAGPTEGPGPFSVFSWTGRPDDAPRAMADIGGVSPRFVPEALFYDSHERLLRLLSDDGGSAVLGPNGSRPCKQWGESPGLQSFRGLAQPLE